mmetsp:Transcript_97575/g.244541  ORF Transcript_97575/g.244541 Transcript_97575/m.244541 type:complete len:210 (-) Transcript_97575:989-1618(-)
MPPRDPCTRNRSVPPAFRWPPPQNKEPPYASTKLDEDRPSTSRCHTCRCQLLSAQERQLRAAPNGRLLADGGSPGAGTAANAAVAAVRHRCGAVRGRGLRRSRARGCRRGGWQALTPTDWRSTCGHSNQGRCSAATSSDCIDRRRRRCCGGGATAGALGLHRRAWSQPNCLRWCGRRSPGGAVCLWWRVRWDSRWRSSWDQGGDSLRPH